MAPLQSMEQESLDLTRRTSASPQKDRPHDANHPSSSSKMDVDLLLDPSAAIRVPRGLLGVLVWALILPSIFVLAFGLYDVSTIVLHFTLYSLKERTEISLLAIIVIELAIVWYNLRSPARIYLLDFATFKPHENYKKSSYQATRELFSSKFPEDLLEFQMRVLERSGVGEETYFPPGVWNYELTMANARNEAEIVMFGALDELFEKTGLAPKDIDILIVNCSLFCPTPSLASMIINHYKMKHDIQSYNLGGMGCSAGVISLALAKDLLKARKNCNAVVVSTENITMNWMGCGAVLLSNKPKYRKTAKYRLLHVVRTHLGYRDDAFKSIYEMQDEEGLRGVALSREIPNVAGDAITVNLKTLGPKVLPGGEKIKFVWNWIQRKVLKRNVKPFVPDFRKVFQHFCIHTGGRGVIDALEKKLKLSEKDIEPSRWSLKRWGNVSSSSIWYELEYIENQKRMHQGDKVWQLAFGSGFKCNSAVWQAL